MTDDLHRAIGNVEAKVDILLDRSKGYDERITSIEKKVWWSSGASAIVAFIAANILGKH